MTVKRTGAKIPSAKSVEGYGVVEGDILILQKSDALSHGKKTGAYSKHVVPTRQTIKTLDDFMMVWLYFYNLPIFNFIESLSISTLLYKNH